MIGIGTRASALALRVVCASVLVLADAGASAADGVAKLRQFMDGTLAAQGEFEQVVHAASGRKPQRAAGSFAFVRPGKFRWHYEVPYAQLLVSDGKRLWAWDKDLNQVTVKRLGEALGATPAAILAGSGELEQNFELSEAGEHDGLTWVSARPRQAESGFESMRIGFAGNVLRRMELRDNFGQTTRIEFTRFIVNPALDGGLFHFTPPPGADVIGDGDGDGR